MKSARPQSQAPVRRGLAVRVAGVVAVLATLVAGAGAASAAGPPIVPLSPANGASIVRAASTQPVAVQFTCPVFETSYETLVESYWVSLSTSPALNYEGVLAQPYLVDFTRATATGPGTCGAELSTGGNAFLAGTYYWQAERINCDALYCTEVSPVSAVTLSDPPPPLPVPSPSPGAGSVTAYTACGLSRNAAKSSVCAKRSPVGAFFKSSVSTSYSICVRYPGGKTLCASKQQAQAGVLYVNRITSNAVGRYKVTWKFDGRRVVRFYRKLA